MPRILIVDDEPDVSKSISFLLRISAWGGSFGPLEGLFDVDTAASGAEALVRLQQQPDLYHLLIVDELMPEMDGFELLAALRRDLNPTLHTLPTICMTQWDIKNMEGEQIPYLWGDEEGEYGESDEDQKSTDSCTVRPDRSDRDAYYSVTRKKDRFALCFGVRSALERYPPPPPTDNRFFRRIKKHFRSKALCKEEKQARLARLAKQK